MSTYFFLGDKTAPEGASPLSFPVSSFGLLKAGGPSRTPTRENSAPTSAWSCRHCPQDCAPAALATLRSMPSPPGRASPVPFASALFGVPALQVRVACQFEIQLNKSTQFRVNICHQMVSILAPPSLFFTGYAGDSIRRGV